MINQHRYRWCLGAMSHQAITWANVDPYLCHHIVLLGHIELKTPKQNMIILHGDIVLVIPLPWLHNEHDGVSNHQPHDCLLKCLFVRTSKKTSKLRVTGLCEGHSAVTSEVPAQKASNAANVFIQWCHHEVMYICQQDQKVHKNTQALLISNF